MIKLKEIQAALNRGLKSTTKVIAITANQNGERPKYPFIETNFINGGRPIGHLAQYMQKGRRVYEQDFEMTASVHCYSDNMEQAEDLAYAAYQHFLITGVRDLQEQHITIVSVNLIENRTSVLTVGYEYHYGFDVLLRVRSQTITEPELIDAVEIEIDGQHEGKGGL